MSDGPKRPVHEIDQLKEDLRLFNNTLRDFKQQFDNELRELNQLINEKGLSEEKQSERSKELTKLREDITRQEELVENLEQLIEQKESRRYEESVGALEDAHREEQEQKREEMRQKIKRGLNIKKDQIDIDDGQHEI